MYSLTGENQLGIFTLLRLIQGNTTGWERGTCFWCKSPAKVLLVFTVLFHVHMNDSATILNLKYYLESDVENPTARWINKNSSASILIINSFICFTWKKMTFTCMKNRSLATAHMSTQHQLIQPLYNSIQSRRPGNWISGRFCWKGEWVFEYSVYQLHSSWGFEAHSLSTSLPSTPNVSPHHQPHLPVRPTSAPCYCWSLCCRFN